MVLEKLIVAKLLITFACSMKINCPIHVFAPLTPMLSQINPVHTLARYIFVGYLTLLQVVSSRLIILPRFRMHFSTFACCAYLYHLSCSPLIGSTSYLVKTAYIFLHLVHTSVA